MGQMSHTVGDRERQVIINHFYEGAKMMTTNNHTNNSTTISGGTVSGNQFAAGSTDFKGTINNISAPQQQEIKQLTNSLIEALQSEKESIKDANVEEITDAIEQVKEAATKETVNKLSLNGLLTGINMVMQNISGISASTKQLYQEWHGHVASLFM